MNTRPEICHECPFKRNSAPGYLGGNNLMAFLADALSDESVPCHIEFSRNVAHEGGSKNLAQPRMVEIDATTLRCRGAATMQRNQLKQPRDVEAAARLRQVPLSPECFTWNDEFILYHAAELDSSPDGNFEIVCVYIGGQEAKRSVRARTKAKARAIMARLITTRAFTKVFVRHWRSRTGQATYIVLHSETLTLAAHIEKEHAPHGER